MRWCLDGESQMLAGGSFEDDSQKAGPFPETNRDLCWAFSVFVSKSCSPRSPQRARRTHGPQISGTQSFPKGQLSSVSQGRWMEVCGVKLHVRAPSLCLDGRLLGRETAVFQSVPASHWAIALHSDPTHKSGRSSLSAANPSFLLCPLYSKQKLKYHYGSKRRNHFKFLAPDLNAF